MSACDTKSSIAHTILSYPNSGMHTVHSFEHFVLMNLQIAHLSLISQLGYADGVGGASIAEDSAAIATVMTSADDGEGGRASRALGTVRIGHPSDTCNEINQSIVYRDLYEC